MSAVTRHIESLLRENSELNQVISDVIKNTQKEALLNGDNVYFHDEAPITKPILRTKGPERYSETPYISIAEAGGQTTTLNVDNNRSIQILARIPEDYIEIVVREIQKTLDNTYNRTLPFGDLNYWYYGFNEIGQPLYLTKKNGAVLYSIKYSAGYTVAEPVKGGSGEDKWPWIIEDRYYINPSKNNIFTVTAKETGSIKIPIKMFFTPSMSVSFTPEDTKNELIERQYIEGETFFVKEAGNTPKVLGMEQISSSYIKGLANFEKLYAMIGFFRPKDLQEVEYKYYGEGYSFFRNDLLPISWGIWAPEYLDRGGDLRYDLGSRGKHICILKTSIFKKDAPEDLQFVLSGLINKRYYRLKNCLHLGRICDSELNVFGFQHKDRDSGSYMPIFSDRDPTFFDTDKDMIIKEEEDKFLIYFIFYRHLFGLYYLGDGKWDYVVSDDYSKAVKIRNQTENKSGNVIMKNPDITKEEDKFWIIDELKQKEGIVLPFEVC